MKKSISTKTLVICIIVVFMATFGISFLLFHNSNVKTNNVKSEIMDLRHGDDFSGFEFFDENDNKLDTLPKADKPSVVFYISSSCSGCKKVMDSYDSFQSVLGEEYNFYCMWLSEIPSFASEKYKINNNYALKNKYMFATSTPSVFLIDTDNKVDFVTAEIETLVDKLLAVSDENSKENFKKNALEYILDKYSKDIDNPNQLIYFSMEGCPDCKAADEVISKSDKLKKYEITKIYHKNATDETLTIDSFKLFQEVFDVEWYPSFYVINNGDKEFVGEVPIDELEQNLY